MSIDILFVVSNFNVGGTEQHLCQILPRLKHLGWNIKVFATAGRGVMAPTIDKARIEIISPTDEHKSSHKFKRYCCVLTSLRRIIKRLKPKVVHSYLPGPYLLSSVALFGINNVSHIMSRRTNQQYLAQFPLTYRLEKLAHLTVDFVLGNSQQIASELSQELGQTRSIGIIYNGIDTNHFAHTLTKTQARKQLGLDSNKLILVIVASLFKIKGHEYLLKALRQVQAQIPDWQLLVVGRDAGYGEMLKQLTNEYQLNDKVIFCGQQLDTLSYYCAADIYISSSILEGFSNSLIEAMYCGLPVIATRVSGSTEALDNTGAGLLVEPANSEQLAQAITTLANDTSLRNSMGTEAKKVVEHNYTIGRTIRAYDETYRCVIKHNCLPSEVEVSNVC